MIGVVCVEADVTDAHDIANPGGRIGAGKWLFYHCYRERGSHRCWQELLSEAATSRWLRLFLPTGSFLSSPCLKGRGSQKGTRMGTLAEEIFSYKLGRPVKAGET